MRILFFFCDMLRPDKVENGAVYDLFRRLGGTWYTNAYTPTPETPRATVSSLHQATAFSPAITLGTKQAYSSTSSQTALRSA